MNASQKQTLFFATLLGIINTFAVLMIAWACNRGFDLSDECYYYLGYLYHDNNPSLSPASFHLMYDKFFGALNATLPEVRLLRLLLTIAASMVFYYGLKKVITEINPVEKFILFNVVLSGMLISYGWAPLALSYNSMSSILICLIAGLWLLQCHNNRLIVKTIYACLLGSLFTMLFFVKITNLLLLPILIGYSFYLLYTRRALAKGRNLLIYILAFGLGIFGALSYISSSPTLIFQTLDTYIQQSFGTLNDDPTHGIEYLKARYIKNFEMVLTRLKYPVMLLLVALAILKVLQRFKEDRKALFPLVFKILSAVILIVMIFQNSYWQGGTGYKYLMLIPFIFIGVSVLLNNFLETGRKLLTLLVLLVCIPLAGAIGTNNGLSAQVLFYGVFIFLAIYTEAYHSNGQWYKNIVLAVVVLLATSQITSATIYRPYRQSILTENINKLEDVASLNNLLVDDDIRQLKEELAFISDLEPQYLFTYSPFGGITLLSDKKPVSLEWFNNTDTGKICKIINGSAIEANNIIFVLPKELPLEAEVQKCLEENNIQLARDYTLEKEIKFHSKRYKKTLNLGIYLPN